MYVTEEPDVLENDYKRCFKYPFMACEALCFTQDCFIDQFLQMDDPDMQGSRLKKLFSVLKKDKYEDELNTTITGFVSKIVEKLAHSVPDKVIPFIYDKEIMEGILFKEFDDFSVVNILLKVIALPLSCHLQLKEKDTKFDRRKEMVLNAVDLLKDLKFDNSNSIYT